MGGVALAVLMAAGCSQKTPEEKKALLARLLKSDNSLVIRTDFSNESAWKSICATIRRPDGKAFVDFVDDRAFEGATEEELIRLIPERSLHGVIFLVDRVAISHPERAILAVNLRNDPERRFRVVPSQVEGVENNLGTFPNMFFREFAESVDKEGIFRGFPKP